MPCPQLSRAAGLPIARICRVPCPLPAPTHLTAGRSSLLRPASTSTSTASAAWALGPAQGCCCCCSSVRCSCCSASVCSPGCCCCCCPAPQPSLHASFSTFGSVGRGRLVPASCSGLWPLLVVASSRRKEVRRACSLWVGGHKDAVALRGCTRHPGNACRNHVVRGCASLCATTGTNCWLLAFAGPQPRAGRRRLQRESAQRRRKRPADDRSRAEV